jgi:ubiquitin carboxyl-terminal hydrolase 10
MQVPWLSVGDKGFPGRAPRRKRKIPRSSLSSEPIVFPLVIAETATEPIQGDKEDDSQPKNVEEIMPEPQMEIIPISEAIETPTPQTSDAPSDTGSTQPTTPSSAVPTQTSKAQQTPTQPKSRPVAPIIPAVPILPTSPTASRKPHRDSVVSIASKLSVPHDNSDKGMDRRQSDASPPEVTEPSPTDSEHTSKPASPPAPPKSWADLVRSKAPPPVFGNVPTPTQLPNGLGATKSESLSEVLNTMSSDSGIPASKTAFLQPRGLVNNSNTCYMNSVRSALFSKTINSLTFQVLQILIFCVPFYDFLDKIALKATHQFKSDTPVIDAM